MIRLIVLLLFVLFLAVSPVYMFDRYVLPQLGQLQAAYGRAGQAADALQSTVRP